MDYIYRDYMGELYMGGLYMGDSIRTIYAGMYMGIYDKSSFYISYGSKNNQNVGCQLITFTNRISNFFFTLVTTPITMKYFILNKKATNSASNCSFSC